MNAAVTAFIGVGANLGFARDAVLNALADLSHLPQTEVVAASSLYQSKPIDAEGPDFINAVAEVTTTLSAMDLLGHLWSLEKQAGRVRTERNAPRTLDLDLLLYGDAQSHTDVLTLPHPRMHTRAFVLMPLVELAPEVVVPGQGQARELLAGLSSQAIARLDD